MSEWYISTNDEKNNQMKITFQCSLVQRLKYVGHELENDSQKQLKVNKLYESVSLNEWQLIA